MFFLAPVTSINSLSKSITLRYGKLFQLEKKMSLFCNFKSIVYVLGTVEELVWITWEFVWDIDFKSYVHTVLG